MDLIGSILVGSILFAANAGLAINASVKGEANRAGFFGGMAALLLFVQVAL